MTTEKYYFNKMENKKVDRRKATLYITKKEFGLLLLLLMMIFQNPLGQMVSFFSYMDELVALSGILLMFLNCKTYFKTIKKVNEIIFPLAFSAFMFCGIIGNIIYKYQPFKVALLDVFTNMKFYCSVAFGMYVCKNICIDKFKNNSLIIFKFTSVVMFALFLADRFINIYDGEYRFGIKTAKLFFNHPTYLAAAIIAILCVFTLFYEPNNNVYILGHIIMLIFTLRSKAMIAAFIYVILFWFVQKKEKKIRIWHILMIALCAIYFAWDSISFYFGDNITTARSVMLLTSFIIMRDYFPIGTGFGTYASHQAASNYSPVYEKYGFSNIYGLSLNYTNQYFDDQYWPIIFGQTGVLGTIFYLLAFFVFVNKCWKLRNYNKMFFFSAIFGIAYLLISSTAEAAFNNPIAAPIGMIIGMLFSFEKENVSNFVR